MQDTPDLQTGVVLGFDFGLKRLGIAVGTLDLRLAHPLETINSEINVVRFSRIDAIIKEWQPVRLILGMPHHDDDSPHEFAPACLKFGQRLKGRFRLPVLWVDERYSSTAASMALNMSGVRGRKQKAMIDQVAAQQILQQYFDESDSAHELA